MKKLLAILLAAAMLLGMCSFASAEDEPSYTLHEYMGASPLNWNPHAWEMNNESDLMVYTLPGLVDTTIAADGVNFEWVYEMADAITDITATFADKEKYGIPADATEGWVFQLDLNKDAKWNDGTPINADSYVYSMKALLDPQMKNYRANTYISGDSAIANGYNYFYNDKVGQPILKTLGSLGYTKAGDAIADGKTELYVDMAGFWNVTDANGNGVLPVTDDTMIRDAAVADENDAEAFVSAKYLYETYLQDGASYESMAPDYLQCVDGVFEETPFEDVGLIKTGDYQLVWVNEDPTQMFYFLTSLTSSWLVKEDLYEANKKTVENLVATDYCTSLETTASYGPYQMVSFETDKQIVLERDPNWFGWTDGKHEGQFAPTRIVIDIIPDHNTALQLFNQGNLDSIELNGDDMATYRMSDYLLKTDQTYTFRFVFATDLTALTALEQEANDGANKKVLSYKDFRKAISLSMDRNILTSQATSAYKPAYSLYSNLYYYDIANDPTSIYRNSTYAKEAVLALYGIEYGEGTNYATLDDAYAAVTGYDLEEAQKLFQAAYEEAIKDGNYTDGQEIHINCMASAATTMDADTTKQQDLMNQFVAAATVGTGFEGKITFTFKVGAPNRYDDVAQGRIEMIRGAWGGAAFYPFSSIRVYCEPDYMGGLAKIHESCGWDPSKATIEVTCDFDKDGTVETKTDTFQNWAILLNSASLTDMDVKLKILSTLETGIMATYQCIPWATETMATMYSQKISYATLDYNIMYGYGGTRLMKFNFSDAEWAAYVADQGGVLSYE
ncbi:MAG: ABC transporter substrate-binding protein [Eubacteriales bacterium]|nr:ABC transporter substrate-binding protein [Eubacteriales bacterium]MDD3882856.1 ABC transporter substrate-binding protein [Eubacteriales bacterium]MDD4512108.1 ABC transporter substrate-binding protein [Eubacteriales bacterium]